MIWKMIFLFQACIVRFHVSLPGCSNRDYNEPIYWLALREFGNEAIHDGNSPLKGQPFSGTCTTGFFEWVRPNQVQKIQKTTKTDKKSTKWYRLGFLFGGGGEWPESPRIFCSRKNAGGGNQGTPGISQRRINQQKKTKASSCLTPRRPFRRRYTTQKWLPTV